MTVAPAVRAFPVRFASDDLPTRALRHQTAIFAEARLGRPLTVAERHMDLLAIDRALEDGKAKLREAIDAEKRRAIGKHVHTGAAYRPSLTVTPEMLAILTDLYEEGRRQALAELSSIGVRRAAFATATRIGSLDVSAARLQTHLDKIGLRINREAETVIADFGSLGVGAIVREIDRSVPGALDAASRLVSGAFDSGLGDVFTDNADLIGRWQYSAAMDGATSFLPETEIATADGPRAIRDVTALDSVLTPAGWERPLAEAAFPYAGEVVEIHTASHHLRVTAEHRIRALDSEGRSVWVEARTLSVGQAVLCKEPREGRPHIEDVALRDADEGPTGENRILASSGLGADRVPEGAVGFNGDAILDDEVNAPSPSDGDLLLVREPEFVERASDGSFEDRARRSLLTAGEGAVATAAVVGELGRAYRAGDPDPPRSSETISAPAMPLSLRTGNDEALSAIRAVEFDPVARVAAGKRAVAVRGGFDRTPALLARRGWRRRSLLLLPPRSPRGSTAARSTPSALTVPASQGCTDRAFARPRINHEPIISLVRKWYEGYVHDLTMLSGSLLADGIVAHNCDPCAGLDGEEFDTWDAISEVLPDGGPNPDCDGDGRCRCRPVPIPPEEPGFPAETAPSSLGGGGYFPVDETGAIYGVSDPVERSDLVRGLLGDSFDTKALYTDEAGAYTAEREALHREIVDEILRDGRFVADEERRTTMLAGGSGSGKSTTLERLREAGKMPEGAVHLDADAIKTGLPEFQKLAGAKDKLSAWVTHEESSDILTVALKEANARGFNIIWDGTGDSTPGKFLRKLDEQAATSRVDIVLVDAPLDDSIVRAMIRAKRSGRFVPETVIRDIHQAVSRRFLEWSRSESVSEWQVWTNAGKPGEEVLTATGGGGRLTILDRKFYDDFIGKGQPGETGFHKPLTAISDPKRLQALAENTGVEIDAEEFLRAGLPTQEGEFYRSLKDILDTRENEVYAKEEIMRSLAARLEGDSRFESMVGSPGAPLNTLKVGDRFLMPEHPDVLFETIGFERRIRAGVDLGLDLEARVVGLGPGTKSSIWELGKTTRFATNAPSLVHPVRPIRLGDLKVGDRFSEPTSPSIVWRVEGYTERGGVEARIVRTDFDIVQVGDRTELSVGYEAIREIIRMPEMVSRTSEYGMTPHERAVSVLVKQWALSSDSGNPWSVAMQHAIREEFDLPLSTLDRFVGLGIYSDGTLAEILDTYGPALRAYARAMYESTQEEFRSRGITHLRLYRGQGLPEDVIARLGGSGFYRDAVEFQPASSWSHDYLTAKSFAHEPGGIIHAEVPVERIIGSARTGYGCLGEMEFVVSAAPEGVIDEGWMHVLAPYAGEGWKNSVEDFFGGVARANEIGARGLLRMNIGDLGVGQEFFDQAWGASAGTTDGRIIIRKWVVEGWQDGRLQARLLDAPSDYLASPTAVRIGDVADFRFNEIVDVEAPRGGGPLPPPAPVPNPDAAALGSTPWLEGIPPITLDDVYVGDRLVLVAEPGGVWVVGAWSPSSAMIRNEATGTIRTIATKAKADTAVYRAAPILNFQEGDRLVLAAEPDKGAWIVDSAVHAKDWADQPLLNTSVVIRRQATGETRTVSEADLYAIKV